MKYRNEIFLLHICIVEDLQVTARSIELKFSLLTFFYKRKKVRDHGGEGTPVPIPNTVVKLARGDNTWLVTAREDNTLRTLLYSSIAQLVEHAAVNRRVVGSSPT